ncbi:hypothetical protein [Streptosporangium subroseum]|uniref:hypothetical protein n=1 Tax=Streptosporangium subroseum TaxID=106412 RepID=UPI003091B297|nr:hypothetical protein OHB15_46855 [Streptosporangium subroseum]
MTPKPVFQKGKSTTLANDEADTTLIALVNIVNNIKDHVFSGPDVVLTVGGLVISGQVIPNWLWFQSIQENHREARLELGNNLSEEAQGWEIFFENIRNQFIARRDEMDKIQEVVDSIPERYQSAILDADETAYIHLKNAKVFSPGQNPLPGNGMYWRGQISAVTGWSFGLLSSPKEG